MISSDGDRRPSKREAEADAAEHALTPAENAAAWAKVLADHAAGICDDPWCRTHAAVAS